ncbi:teichoic acid D-Ala incorporation-associated protein DltX [Desulfitobacterium sp. Sab5]|uniref:teichoic acid D-Ala incorporation-associated protein DltX n=1 Tax=Desulfitobacterium nosdiversum TaxID=3375356 RepID=UPI003CF265B3
MTAIFCRTSCTWDGKDGSRLIKQWISSIIKGPKGWNPTLLWLGRVFYYYFIFMALFYLYFVQKQHTPAPYIYNNF